MFKLMELPFKEDALEPYISAETISYHYGKHHKGYVDKTNELIAGTEFQDLTLEEVIEQTHNYPDRQALYNNAGQVYNHNVYWQSIGIGERLNDDMKKKIESDLGGTDALKKELADKAMAVFGSGWVWLAEGKGGKLEVLTTKNGDTPLVLGYKPIFNMDVWEHAYYLDYQNRRKDYAEVFAAQLLKL